ncbi:MAG: hypothetical protein ABI610_06905 [Acidobacteriota bacterium]
MRTFAREVGRPVPFTHTFDPEKKIARIVAVGECDLDSSLAEMLAISSDPRLASDFGVLLDAREVRYDPTNDEIVTMAETWIRLAGRRALAMVVADVLHVGLGNMFAIHFETRGGSASVFRDLTEAEVWLSHRIERELEG